ncbi:adenosine deaminase-like isoform X2 [Limulus polyphemus]|uniref:adenosine deaminase n=1 Tax=Limulus polyphemus TaxID=6850 RepID=A0ABM1SAY8_LIMPO|nr:adenosine deaminase-like isoform X2 [Limulus polyphemus]
MTTTVTHLPDATSKMPFLNCEGRLRYKQFDPEKLPKARVELHLHLDGSLRLTTIWELAQKKGIDLGCATLEDLKNTLIITKPKKLSDFLKPFHIFMPTIIGDSEALERVAYELCEDQAKQGVCYFEARFSPHLCSNTDGLPPDEIVSPDDDRAVTPKKVVESILKGLKRGEKDFNIKARAILCCIVGQSEWAEEVLQLCVEFKNQGVVAIDIAGDEAGEIVTSETEEHWTPKDIMIFQKAQSLGIHRTAHAGEGGPAANVARAIKELQVERIGHGYHSIDDEEIYNQVLNLDIHLEACPYSSYLTGSVPLTTLKHPIIRYAEDNANFSINKDDSTITGTTLDDEYELLQCLGLREVHFVRANFNAARSAFLPEDEKEELLNHLKKMYGNIVTKK